MQPCDEVAASVWGFEEMSEAPTFNRIFHDTEEYDGIYFDYEVVSALKELMRHLKLKTEDEKTLITIINEWRKEWTNER